MDVMNCANFFVDQLRGIDLVAMVGGLKFAYSHRN